MSNRRRLRPPVTVTRFAAAYACTDCTGRAGRLRLDAAGVWHLTVEHDDGCPVLAGVTSPSSAALKALGGDCG